MRSTHLFLLPLLSLATVQAQGPGHSARQESSQFNRSSESLHFAPTRGEQLSKSFRRTLELNENKRTVQWDNRAPEEFTDQGLQIFEERQATFTDEYIMQIARQPLPELLRRRYTQLEGRQKLIQGSNLQEGQQNLDFALSSPLANSTVVFAWNKQERRHEAQWEGSAPSAANTTFLLQGLTEDTDLRALLPPISPIAPGKSWPISLDRLQTILAPGGDLRWLPKPGELPRGMNYRDAANGGIDDWVGQLQGTATATFSERIQREGRSLARIQLSLDLHSNRDLTEKSRAEAGRLSREQSSETAFDYVEVGFALQGSGELLWDSARGLPYSLQLDAQIGVILDSGLRARMDQRWVPLVESRELSGRLQLAMQTTVAATADPQAGAKIQTGAKTSTGEEPENPENR